KNLKTHDKGRTYTVIKENLEKLGYIVKEQVINTKDITNLPQNRERIYIVAFLDKQVAKQFDLFDRIDSMKNKWTEEERINHIRKAHDFNINQEENKKYNYKKKKNQKYILK